MTEAMARLKSLLATQEQSAKSDGTPFSALLAPQSGEHGEKTAAPSDPATDPAGELPAAQVASPRARDNRPAVDAPAPGAAARATAGAGREPEADASTPPAGNLPPPDSAGRSHVAPVAHLGARPACGHDALVVLTVKGRGRICGDCWRLWVRGDIDWPGKV